MINLTNTLTTHPLTHSPTHHSPTHPLLSPLSFIYLCPMQFWPSVWGMLKKDLILEMRQKYAISGILLYMLCIVFIIFMTFGQGVRGPVWVVLFWLIMLFTSVNAVAKSFLQESTGRLLYYYTIASPQAIILAKMLYNIGLMILMSALALLMHSITSGYPIVDSPSFLLANVLGAIAFATTFSMISAIASKASNSGTMMAILSFPILIPILIILIRISLNAIQQNNLAVNLQDLMYLAALDVMILAMALILFPYLWRD